MAIDEKAPSELRPILFNLAPQISGGATILSMQAFASLKVSGFSTTLAAPAAAEASTVTLTDNPLAGALLTINPSPTASEVVKVVSMAGNVATLSHTLENGYSSGTPVNYEPGANARLLVTTTPIPVGTQVTVWTQNGADGKIYRISVVFPLSDGQQGEEERDLVVTEHASLSTKTIQVDVIADIEFGFDAPVALSGHNLTSALAWMSREQIVSSQVSVTIVPGAATIQIAANPGIGAMLTLNPTGPRQEKLKVSDVTGAGPFVCTVDPTPEFDHAATEPMQYNPGVTTRLLVSPTPSILGATKARVRKRRGQAGQRYRLTLLGTLATTLERVQGSCFVDVVEE